MSERDLSLVSLFSLSCGLLMALTGLDLAVATQGVWLIASGLTGMLGAASVDLGPFASVEQAALAESVSPLRRNIDQSEVADAALFLLSNMSRGVTGEVLHVDCGYNIMGM